MIMMGGKKIDSSLLNNDRIIILKGTFTVELLASLARRGGPISNRCRRNCPFSESKEPVFFMGDNNDWGPMLIYISILYCNNKGGCIEFGITANLQAKLTSFERLLPEVPADTQTTRSN